MRALELARKVGDERRIALISHQMGLVFEYQGRFGAAVNSMQDAVKNFRQQGEKNLNMAEFLKDLAGALVRDGRSNEASAPLEEAQKIQQTLKNDALQAAILNTRGDLAFYQGDLKNAAQYYDSSLRLASRTKDGEELLLAKVGGVSVAVAQGQYAQAKRSLETLLETKGSIAAHLALRMHLELARASIGLKDYIRANHELEQELPGAQRAGVRYGLATIYYLLGTSARLSGSAERARDYYRESAQLLDAIRSDSGSENMMHRLDFKTMYDESNRWKR
jgi:tetratricopeptide (TPR) repeat protein